MEGYLGLSPQGKALLTLKTYWTPGPFCPTLHLKEVSSPKGPEHFDNQVTLSKLAPTCLLGLTPKNCQKMVLLTNAFPFSADDLFIVWRPRRYVTGGSSFDGCAKGFCRNAVKTLTLFSEKYAYVQAHLWFRQLQRWCES